MRKLVALVDFSGVSDTAIAHAGAIHDKTKTQSELTLLHIMPSESKSSLEEVQAELQESGKPLENQDIPFKTHVAQGEFYEIINAVLSELEANVVIVGTHGMRGRKRNLYSENILQLISQLSFPTLVVQGHLDSTPGVYNHVLIPVLGKVEGVEHADLITLYTSAVGSKLHVLNFVNSDDESDDTSCAEELIKQFHALGTDVELTRQYTSANTQNYGLVIEELANQFGADLIVWTRALGEEAKQMSSENKTNLILNKYGIPALLML